MAIISGTDLTNVPGIPANVDLDYLARRASSAVEAAWCHPVNPAPAWVKDIAIDVALRGASNPMGRTSRTLTRSIDDASRSETERYDSGAVGWALTDEERSRLCPIPRRGIGSMRLRVPGYQP